MTAASMAFGSSADGYHWASTKTAPSYVAETCTRSPASMNGVEDCTTGRRSGLPCELSGVVVKTLKKSSSAKRAAKRGTLPAE